MDSVNMDTLRKYVNPVIGQIGVDVNQLAGLQNGNPFIIFGQKSSSAIPGQATLILPQNNGTPAKLWQSSVLLSNQCRKVMMCADKRT
jgi:hypothetical protein